MNRNSGLDQIDRLVDRTLGLDPDRPARNPYEPNYPGSLWIIEMSRSSGGRYEGWIAAENVFYLSEIAAKEHMDRLAKKPGAAWDYRVARFQWKEWTEIKEKKC